ncbi:MAG: aspartate 1-decarboxylase [bacterium]
MLRFIHKSKIHRAVVTEANLEYEGSITVDPVLLDAAEIYPNEMVWVLNLNNGERFETYVIEGKRGSGDMCLNGPAAHLGAKGDKIIVLSTAAVEDEKARKFKPIVIHVDEKNRIVKKV